MGAQSRVFLGHIALAACLVGLVGCAGADSPRPTSAATPAPTEPAAKTQEAHRLAVRLRGAGSVTGRVVSSPPGIDCEIVTNGGGTNEKECEATFPSGPVTLQFTPSGAAQVAQFSFVRTGQHETCPSKNGQTCTVTLDHDERVEVSPISVPPPAP